MTFERTEDLQLVHRMVTDPRAWRRMTSDDAPLMDRFRVKPSDIQYVIAHTHGMVVALFLLRPIFPTVAEVHFCFRPEAWGYTQSIAEGFLSWVWEHTSLYTLTGPIPEHNRLALKLAKAVGFVEFAKEKDCLTKRGRIYDRIMLTISRPEAMCSSTNS